MPELPEVEVVRRGLERGVVGRTVTRVTVAHPRAVRRHLAGPEDFAERLCGRRIDSVQRRGKYLWLPLDSGDALTGHLGMSGQLLVVPVGRPDELHLRVRVEFEGDDRELRFVDQRTFGGLTVAAAGAALPRSMEHIARDPIDPEFDEERFLTGLRRRHTGIKRALLDQTLVSGIGNIYADESLWAARLHFARPTETMSRPEARRLLAAVRQVLGASLEAGGTSFDALFVSADGVSGLFARDLGVYGRGGQPCPRCATPIRRDPFMNRSSFTCPRCQPRPRRARW